MLLPALEVKEHLGITDIKNFRREIREDTRVIQKLIDEGIVCELYEDNRYYYVKTDFEHYFGSFQEGYTPSMLNAAD